MEGAREGETEREKEGEGGSETRWEKQRNKSTKNSEVC